MTDLSINIWTIIVTVNGLNIPIKIKYYHAGNRIKYILLTKDMLRL